MALKRGADLNPKAIELYAESLAAAFADTDEQIVMRVIGEYGDTPQLAHEKAFPDYGTLKLLIEDQIHPLRVLRQLVRSLARNYGATVDPVMLGNFETACGHRTDEDLLVAYSDILKFREGNRMPTAQEFLRACGVPKLYRNGSRPQD